MVRLAEESFQRNREKQRKRNVTNNAERARTFGRLDSDIRRLEGRSFIGWDGEGYNAYVGYPDGTLHVQHRYMLFGCSTQQYIESLDLGTRECLDLILFIEREHPDCYHVGFSFEYDVNMILRDLEWRYLAVLKCIGVVKWRGYRIKHIPHKSFSVSKDGVNATIYDVFGFFHESYLKALKKFGIGTDSEMSIVTAGKSGRSLFSYTEISSVITYWSAEISLLPPLMDKIRDACYSAGFFITQWHGPGALASFALKKYGVFKWKAGKNVPVAVQIARQLAYAGGRFQGWKCGVYDGPVYTADINSAYAYACSLLPRLDNGKWAHSSAKDVRSPRDISDFALYRIRLDARALESKARVSGIPFPLFHRDSKGNLTWPPYVENWYWSPEAALVAGSEYAEFLEAWVYRSDSSRPFQFVRGAYERRVELQSAGNPVEKAYKWFLASIYGQFAQRVGWDKDKRLAPRSHQLEWAGFITSYCRAMVFRAAISVARKGGLISIDTDGVTSTIPFDPESLPLGTGTGLGEWKLETYNGILYWQNGIYWFRNMDGTWQTPKTRGVPRGTIDIATAFAAMAESDTGKFAGNPVISLRRNRFIGYRQALQSQYDTWRNWQSEPVKIEFGGSGKGRHVASLCARCAASRIGRGEPDSGTDSLLGALHTITHFWPSEVVSEPHKLPWLEAVGRDDEVNVWRLGIWADDAI